MISFRTYSKVIKSLQYLIKKDEPFKIINVLFMRIENAKLKAFCFKIKRENIHDSIYLLPQP